MGCLIMLLGASWLSACGARDRPRLEVIRGYAMGTTYEIRYAGKPGELPPRTTIEAGVAVVLESIDLAMSTYRADSEVSRFNRHASTAWLPVSADFATVVTEALRISEWSGGAFDVTVGPLVECWGFGPNGGTPRVPEPAEIAKAMARVGYRHLHVRPQPPALRKDIVSLELDLGAIAPGYAVDRLAALIEQHNISDYLVELGGEVYARGHRPDGGRWRVAIERATVSGGEIETVVELNGVGLSTSGNYRNYFERDGRRYSHLIDPLTGSPAAHQVAAVSVVAASTMRADALSTALLVLGESAPPLAELEGIDALFQIASPHGIEVHRTRANRRAVKKNPAG